MNFTKLFSSQKGGRGWAREENIQYHNLYGKIKNLGLMKFIKCVDNSDISGSCDRCDNSSNSSNISNISDPNDI